MTIRAKGEFDVKLSPQEPGPRGEDPAVGRFLLDKQFHGDLAASSTGQMLTAGTAVKGSAGYVAIEKVVGRLHGREGTFVLQHTGTMNRGAPNLAIAVVPDSGTGALEGIAGSMTIIITPGRHSYEFEYSLPAAG